MTPREILDKHLPDWNVYLTESGVKKMIAAMEDYAEQQKNISSNLPVSGSLPDFQDVIEARIKYFNSNHHTYEGSELQNALNIIRRLVPPIQWKIGGQ